MSEGVPPPKKTERTMRPRREPRAMGDFGLERGEVARFVNRRAAHVAIEVAIGTFRQAEGPMDIDPKPRLMREGPRSARRGGRDHAANHLVSLCQRTSARARAPKARPSDARLRRGRFHLSPPRRRGSRSIGRLIAREKQVKKWERQWKLELIERFNPDWQDLYETPNA